MVSQWFAKNFRFGRKLLLAAIGTAVFTVPFVFGLVSATLVHAQSRAPDWEVAAGGKMAFEVASVKQNKSGPPPSGEKPMFNFALDDGDAYSSNGGLLSATNVPLNVYIGFAYKLTPSQTESLLSEMPKWANADRFDIQARAQGTPTKDQMRLMMQNLLTDRFTLTVHAETRQVPVFAAVLATARKTGPQLRPHADGPACDSVPAPATGSELTTPLKAPDIFPPICGALRAQGTSGRIRIGARNVSMGLIAGWLQPPGMSTLDRPVVDRTGLNGNFDFTLEWKPEPRPGVNVVPSDDSGPTFLEALNDQLGLKLKQQIGTVEVLVIDRIEEPSEN